MYDLVLILKQDRIQKNGSADVLQYQDTVNNALRETPTSGMLL